MTVTELLNGAFEIPWVVMLTKVNVVLLMTFGDAAGAAKTNKIVFLICLCVRFIRIMLFVETAKRISHLCWHRPIICAAMKTFTCAALTRLTCIV